ncbi:prostaglandin reductase-3 [Quercus suber]|uniref:Prostaglandin reductase-3 n=1 Tax=Quercus suber TaxID=58331 RepID=A0AAW0KQF3_QUESU
MELKPGLSALVTGGASGIGKALSLALAKKGIFVTVVDFSEENGRQVASLAEKESAKFHSNLEFPSAIFVKCDVSNTRETAAAFEKHLATYGGLDICINCAGISNPIPFYQDKTDGTRSWRHTVNVNLIAVIDCTHRAIKAMESAQKPGVIINMGSASGLYPMYADPIYSGSKGGVVLFTRSLFVQTEMGLKIDSKFVGKMGGFLPMEMVVKGTFELITDESRAGSCLWITNRRGMEYWPSPLEEAKYLLHSSKSKKSFPLKVVSSFQLPHSFEKIVVHTLSHNFRNATSIVSTPLRLPIKPHHVLVKIIYAGVNASDVNFSSGRYFSGSDKDQSSNLPFDAGFEAVGIIAAVGDNVTDLKIGTPAAVMTFGSYAEFIMVPSKHVLPVARPDPEVVAMLTSGLTASIALEKAGQMESRKVVLVTAAAGGTGQFAVQLAKLAGNTVVATCGGEEKAMLLKNLGVDRVIDYRAEDIKTVLKNEFPKGLDIIYESVGGDMFNLCLNALAVYGRLIVIGMISQAGQMESRKVVLVTAAAGGTGQFAVQLAKLAGNTVVATCGGEEKAMLLKNLGVDRVIDYRAEDIKTVLKNEFPKGLDIIYESVGGDMFNLCLNALAVYGRLIVIGMISQYQGKHGWKPSNYTGLCEKILAKSQTVAGFFLVQYSQLWQEHLERLFNLFSMGKLKVAVDPKRFLGLHAVADAVEYLHSGKSVGKVVVCIDPSFSQQMAKL